MQASDFSCLKHDLLRVDLLKYPMVPMFCWFFCVFLCFFLFPELFLKIEVERFASKIRSSHPWPWKLGGYSHMMPI